MLLENKNAIIYEGGSAAGGAVTREFLAGSAPVKLDGVAERRRGDWRIWRGCGGHAPSARRPQTKRKLS